MADRAKGRISRRSWILVLVLLSALLWQAYLVVEEAQRGTMFEKYSSLRAEDDGTMAFSELATRLGRRVERSQEPLVGLPRRALLLCVEPEHNARGATLINTPTPAAPTKPNNSETWTEKELLSILDWVKNGGRLVLISSSASELAVRFGIEIEGATEDRSVTEVKATAQVINRWTRDAKELLLAGRARLNPKDKSWLTLYKSEFGPVAAVRALGEGRVTVLCDPRPIINSGLAEASNAQFIANILRVDSDGPVIIDELRHGLVANRTLMGYLRRRGLHFVALQLLLTFGVVWWAATGRTGRIRAPRPTSEIESSEYITALANIYEKAGLQRHAVNWYEQRLVLVLNQYLLDQPIERLDALDFELVAERLRSAGVANYQGLRAYVELRNALFARSVGGTRLARMFRRDAMTDAELVALCRLALELEAEWLARSEHYNEDRLLRDLDQVLATRARDKLRKAAESKAPTDSKNPGSAAEASAAEASAAEDSAAEDASSIQSAANRDPAESRRSSIVIDPALRANSLNAALPELSSPSIEAHDKPSVERSSEREEPR